MRVSVILCSILVLVAALGGCAPPPEPKPVVDTAAEAQAIRDLSAQWLAWSQAKEASAIAGILAPDAVTIFDGEFHVGPAEIEANAEKNFAEAPDAMIAWTTDEVHVAESGDLAYERGSWVYDKDGEGEAPPESGQYVTIWKKVDGQWKVAVDAGTTIKAEEEEASAE